MHCLGELEPAVMDMLWRADRPFKVRDVVDRLPRALAYTTVMTVLDNLHRKASVQRELLRKALGKPASSPGARRACGDAAARGPHGRHVAGHAVAGR